jgi:hypothetical protein
MDPLEGWGTGSSSLPQAVNRLRLNKQINATSPVSCFIKSFFDNIMDSQSALAAFMYQNYS